MFHYRYDMMVALGLTGVLILLHHLAPFIRRLPFVPEKEMSSFSGGFSVAYVFLHLLPGMVESNAALGQLLNEASPMTPIKELLVYLTGLAGFMIFFGL